MRIVLFKKSVILISILLTIPFYGSSQASYGTDKIMKIALREAGNQLLLSQKDSTTIIAPVRVLSDSIYELSFGAPISFEPSALVWSIEENLRRIDMSHKYTVEVKRCNDREVVYSYVMTNNTESTIVPCLDRPIPSDCYLIEIEMIKSEIVTQKESNEYFNYLIYILLIILALFGAIMSRRTFVPIKFTNFEAYQLGKFNFIPEQLKLVREAHEITLSKKECEILELLVNKINTIVTRDELSKRIWEDNGVIVGRSLDTYISKLRKKLKEDDRIKITNVHGVGYKLELLI